VEDFERDAVAFIVARLEDRARRARAQLAHDAPSARELRAGADHVEARDRYFATAARKVATEAELSRDLFGEALEAFDLALGDRARSAAGDGERADRRAFVHEQRDTRVETNERIAGDQRVVRETRVAVGVFDDERMAMVDAVAAEGEVTRHRFARHPRAP